MSRQEPTDEQVAKAWDRLVADGWQPPVGMPTSAITEILAAAFDWAKDVDHPEETRP